jgi:hypothetical protein
MSLIFGSANSVSAYNVFNSLRFRASASAYLSRTFTTPTSSTIWTWSAWVKRGALTGTYRLFGASTTTYLTFNSSDQLNLTLNGVSAATSTAVFRDPSAWYHIVYTQNGASQTIYVNNVSVATGTTAASIFNTAIAHQIGSANTSNYLDGYLTEINFVDGQSLTPSSFGSTDATAGQWLPKPYSGTYGTNGFYLNFSDNSALTTTTNVGLGKDFSGNANRWTTNNISITSGVTYDSMTDVPTLTSATAANYPVANQLVTLRAWTNYTNGNLTINNGNVNSNFTAVANMTFGTGKYYWETTITAVGGGSSLGIMDVQNISGTITTINLGQGTNTYAYLSTGNKLLSGTSSAYGSSFTTGDVIAFTYDGSTGVLTAYKNNVSQGTMTTLSTSTQYVAAWKCENTTATATQNINFGQRPFSYTPPTGFVALNTYNLPTPTISKGNTVMDATTYTGTGATLSVTNAGAFKPDLVWIKGRSGATDHGLYDFVRGTTKDLVVNTTAAETTQSTGLTAFNSNGFTIGALAKLNTNAATYVGWQWAGTGATVSNTSGSITSTVDANTTAGFSIVTFTTPASGGPWTIGHGLGVAPKLIIAKARSTTLNWVVYHTSTGNTNYTLFNTTALSTGDILAWNNTSPTSTVFTNGATSFWGASATYVAYCWAEIAGFSKFGSYTGNGSADGAFVYTGFKPKFLFIKNSGAAASWRVYDTSRSPTNVSDQILITDGAGAETSGAAIDIVSNGFKLRNTTNNGSSNTYIYGVFAENPFKYSNAR